MFEDEQEFIFIIQFGTKLPESIQPKHKNKIHNSISNVRGERHSDSNLKSL